MTNANRSCRARYLEEWLELAERTARIAFKSREKLSAFTPQPTDIFISPFAKCGTTWLTQKHNPNVLLLTYESMIANFDRSLANIARFMDIELDDELIGIVKKQSSREFMLQHKSKFDEHLNAKKFEALGLAPMNPATSKITSGTPKSERYSISDELKEYFQSTWKATITEQHQIENYEQLVKTIETLS